MKPHLCPLLLQALVLYTAPLAFATTAVSTYDESTQTLTITGITGNGNLSNFSGIGHYAEATKIIFDMADPGTTNTWFSTTETIDKDVQIGATDAEHGLRLYSGASNKTLTFSGTVTGSGTISRMGGAAPIIAFTGDVSGFTGNIILGGTVANAVLRFGGTTTSINNSTSTNGISGTGTITFTTANNLLRYNYSTGKDVYITNTFATEGAGAVSKIRVDGSDNLVFAKNVTIGNLQVTNAAARLTVAQNTTTTIDVLTASATSIPVNKHGAGLMRLTVDSSVSGLTVNVNEGAFQVYNAGGTTLGEINLTAADSKLSYYNTDNGTGTNTLTVNNLNLTADATLETINHAGIVQVENLTGTDKTLTINGAGSSTQTQWVVINGGEFSGTLNVRQSNGGNNRKLVLVATNTNALSNAVVDLSQRASGSGTRLLVFAVGGSAGNEVNIAGLNGIAASNVISGGVAANITKTTLAGLQDGNTRTLTLTGAALAGTAAGAYDYTYLGTIGDNLIIKKTGTSKQSLATIGNNSSIDVSAGSLTVGSIGNNAAVVVSAGTLSLGNIGNNSTIGVSAGTLTLTGTIGEQVTIGLNGGALSGSLTNGTLTATSGALNDFTFNGGVLDFGAAQQNAQSSVSYTGTLAMTAGDIVIDVSALKDGGTYTLLTGTGGSSDLSGLTINGLSLENTTTEGTWLFATTIDLKRYSGEIAWQNSGNLVVQNLSLLSRTLTWSGGTTGTWQNGASSTGWNESGASQDTFFSDGDAVIFQDVTTALTIEGPVDPASIVVSGAADVTLQAGTGASIIGFGTLLVSDTATLTIETSNAFSGGTTITGGVLNANAANALGTGDVDLGGGELVLGDAAALDSNAALIFNGGSLTYASGVTTDISSKIQVGTGPVSVDLRDNAVTWASSPSGNLVVTGTTGSLTLTDATPANGPDSLTINGGNVVLTQASALQNSGDVITTAITMTGGVLTISGYHGDGSAHSGMYGSACSHYTYMLSQALTLAPEAGQTIMIQSDSMDQVKPNGIGVANVNALVYDGSKGGGTATIAANITAWGTSATSTRTFNISDSAGTDVEVDITGFLGEPLTGTDSRSVTLLKTGNGVLRISGENHVPGLTINEGVVIAANAQALGKQRTLANTVTVGNEVGKTATLDLRVSNTTGITQLLGNANGVITNTTAEATVLKIGWSGAASGRRDSSFSGTITGNLGLELVAQNKLALSGTNNYTGSTVVGLNAELSLQDGGSIDNGKAKIQAKAGETSATLKNVTSHGAGIDRTVEGEASIHNGHIAVSLESGASSYAIADLALVNTLVDLQSAGSVTLNNVIIDKTTVTNASGGSVTLSNSTLVMTTTQTTVGALTADTLSVSSTGLAGYTTISGSLTLDLTKEWIDNLVANAGGHFKTIELTFTDVNEAAWNTFKANELSSLSQTGALNDPMFGPPSVDFGSTAGTIIISTSVNIPEPTTATLGLLGLSGLLIRRRRKTA